MQCNSQDTCRIPRPQLKHLEQCTLYDPVRTVSRRWRHSRPVHSRSQDFSHDFLMAEIRPTGTVPFARWRHTRPVHSRPHTSMSIGAYLTSAFCALKFARVFDSRNTPDRCSPFRTVSSLYTPMSSTMETHMCTQQVDSPPISDSCPSSNQTRFWIVPCVCCSGQISSSRKPERLLAGCC